jgi:pimeloyl-ACP methyl ester carboxylesterase
MTYIARMVVALGCHALVACGTEDGSVAEAPIASDRPLDSIEWRPCAALECGLVEVPIDYAAPEAGSIQIAINRARAEEGVPYRGSIVLNPGGPGSPGKAFAAALAPGLKQLLPGFDVVGFDPRGVGDSAALTCALGTELVEAYAEGGVSAVIASLRAGSARCAEQDGELFRHVGSNQVVRDVDRIREALGISELNFLGVSYGTRLGALYALRFPEHARAVVLDAPLAPTADLTEVVVGQFDAVLPAHAAFFEDCAANRLYCPPDPENVFQRILDSATSPTQREQFLATWTSNLSSPLGLVTLSQILRSVAGATEINLVAMTEAGGLNQVANMTTHCADNAVAALTEAEGAALMASFEQRSELFANRGLAALTCSGWDNLPDPVARLEFTPRIPLLVIGGVEDTLTPLPWAEESALTIAGSSLLVSEHYGHGAILFGGACTFQYLKAYFEDLDPVPAGTRCAGP